MSNVLRSLLADPRLLQSIPLSSTSTPVVSSAASDKLEARDPSQILNSLLLERLPDFIHVVSLKGSFLYVAPSVRNVLGYEPEELVGKSISEFCHPADLVPLMRELKESSMSSGSNHDQQSLASAGDGGGIPKTVDILFRAQSKADGYLWMECRGRLHVEPGKGRKAIILSGRARKMPRLKWDSIARAGGIIAPSYARRSKVAHEDVRNQDVKLASEPAPQEFWGMLTSNGTFLAVEHEIRDVLGWEADELIGKGIEILTPCDDGSRHALYETMARISEGRSHYERNTLFMRRKAGGAINVQIVLYTSLDQVPSITSPACPLVFQVKLASLSQDSCIRPTNLAHPLSSDVFEELETSRGTSWQYELQQLKFANQRLEQEIHELEQRQLATLRDFQRHHHPIASSATSGHPIQYSGLKRSWDDRT
jgi:PAS domain S-box-containing protein